MPAIGRGPENPVNGNLIAPPPDPHASPPIVLPPELEKRTPIGKRRARKRKRTPIGKRRARKRKRTPTGKRRATKRKRTPCQGVKEESGSLSRTRTNLWALDLGRIRRDRKGPALHDKGRQVRIDRGSQRALAQLLPKKTRDKWCSRTIQRKQVAPPSQRGKEAVQQGIPRLVTTRRPLGVGTARAATKLLSRPLYRLRIPLPIKMEPRVQQYWWTSLAAAVKAATTWKRNLRVHRILFDTWAMMRLVNGTNPACSCR